MLILSMNLQRKAISQGFWHYSKVNCLKKSVLFAVRGIILSISAKGLDAFYVAHGYSPDAKQMLQNRFVDNINGMQYDGTLFKRSKERKAPHNSYISKDNVLAAMEKTNSSMELSVIPAFSFL